MSRLKPNFEKLDPAQRSLWPELAPAAESGFVLYGGTALSLRFGHRRSLDFDFFNERPLDTREMRDAMPFLGEAQAIQDDGVAEVASPLDLAATKVKVIQQRAEAKDYRDVLALIASGLHLEDALAAARAIYGTSFQASESLKALTYFADGDLPELSEEERRTLVAIATAVERIPTAATVSDHLSAGAGLGESG